MDKLTRVAIPCYGQSKYRKIAQQIIDAFDGGEAVILPPAFEHRRAEIKRQIEVLIHHATGTWPSCRLQTRMDPRGRVVWILTHEDESIIRAAASANWPPPL